ncbi:hypothetical protein L7F22_052192 [Adiantum nelumboides]|nr:hypothetical protein [Adiantum nelumboides]
MQKVVGLMKNLSVHMMEGGRGQGYGYGCGYGSNEGFAGGRGRGMAGRGDMFQCYNCGEWGHKSPQCDKPKRMGGDMFPLPSQIPSRAQDYGVEIKGEAAPSGLTAEEKGKTKVQGTWACKNSKLLQWLHEVKLLMKDFEAIQIQHISRQHNKEADNMANTQFEVMVGAIKFKEPLFQGQETMEDILYFLETGPLPRTSIGKQYILTATDYMTRWAEAASVARITAADVSKFVLDYICSRFGTPLEILSDRGPGFRTDLLDALLENLSIKHVHSTPYYPQCNGLVEKKNGVLCKIITKHVRDRPQDWDKHLTAALWAYRKSFKVSTQFTPYHLVYGQEALLPIEVELGSLRVLARETTSSKEKLEQRILDLQRLELDREAATDYYITQANKKREQFNNKIKEKKLEEGMLVMSEWSLRVVIESTALKIFPLNRSHNENAHTAAQAMIGQLYVIRADSPFYLGRESLEREEGFLQTGLLPAELEKSKKYAFLRRAKKYMLVGDSLYMKGADLVMRRVPWKEEIYMVLEENHEGSCGGHFASKITLHKILQEGYVWPSIQRDVHHWCKSCKECQSMASRVLRSEIRDTISAYDVFERWGIDAIGPLPITARGKCYILTVVDYLFRWAEAKPMKQITSKDVAKFVYEDICCKFGMPLELLFGKGPGFRGELVDYLCEKLHVHRRFTTPYYPQCNGMNERTAIKIGTGFSPFHLVFGEEALLPIEVEIPALKMMLKFEEENHDALKERLSYLQCLQLDRALTLEQYEQVLKTSQAKANAKVKDKGIKKGDMVLRYKSKLDSTFQKKFQIKWQGPFLVLDKFPNGTYQLADLNGTLHKARVNGYRLKKYYARLMVVIEDEPSFEESADMVVDREEIMKTSSFALQALFTTTADHE